MRFLVFIFLFLSLQFNAQVNFVGNPSFEIFHSGCTGPNFVSKLKYWSGIDSLYAFGGGFTYNVCYSNVPYGAMGIYQQPRTGNGDIRHQNFCTNPCSYSTSRLYEKNRLLTNLSMGITYCVKMWVNLENVSPYAITQLQIYFGDVSLDTITTTGTPLTYLSPQITNTLGVINDTLNWIEVKNTFVANGTEKYLLIGNFETDATTISTYSPTAFAGSVWSEYMIDDVSVIDFNLPAYAGPDKNINLGDSAFIGRPPEIGLECTWSSGTTTVGTGGGIWVKPPIGTYSYVVTQNICGNIKMDTVNVNVSPSAISEITLFANNIGIYPQPAKELVNISLNYFYEPSIEVRVVDVNGKLVNREELIVNRGKAQMITSEFSVGVYILQIANSKGVVVNKRLIIAR